MNSRDIIAMLGFAIGGALFWMNSTLQALNGTVHEQTTVLKKLDDKVGKQNNRVDKLERLRDEDAGAHKAVERYGRAILTLMTLGVAIAAVVLSRV